MVNMQTIRFSTKYVLVGRVGKHHALSRLIMERYLWLICVVLIPTIGWSQSNQQLVQINYTSQEGQTYKGSFIVEYMAVIGDDLSPLPSEATEVRFTGKGSEFVEIRFSNLNWETNEFSGSVLFDVGDIAVSKRDVLKPKVKKIILKHTNSSAKTMQFTPLKSGTSSIILSYRIIDGAATGDVHNTFRRSVKIQIGGQTSDPPPTTASSETPQDKTKPQSNDPDPSTEQSEEDKFWNEVVAANATNVAYYEQYIRRFPNGKYKPTAISMIASLKEEAKAKEAEAQRIAEERRKKQQKTNTSTPSSSNKDAEEELYAKIISEGLIADCNEYLRTYQNGKYQEEVEQILADKSPIKVLSSQRDADNKNIFQIGLKFVKGTLDYEIFPKSNEEYVLLTDWDAASNTFFIEVAPDKQFQIQFKDSRGSHFKSNQQKLDTRFEPLTVDNFKVYHDDSNPFTDSLTFQVSGGQAPYFAEFIRFNETEPIYKHKLGDKSTQTTLVIDNILNEANQSEISTGPGTYFIRFVDQRGAQGESVFKNGENEIIRIVPPEEPLPWKLIGGIVGLVVLLLVVRSILNSRKKAKFQKKVEEARKQREQRTTTQTSSGIGIQKVERTTTTVPHQRPIVESGKEQVHTQTPSTNPPPKRKTNFKITKKQPSFEKPVNKKKFAAMGSPDYLLFDLTSQWKNPAVREVYMHQECATDLNQFIYDHNVNEFLEEQNDMIPEIGGFLMGTYELDPSSGQHRVSLEKFQPITAEAQDLYKVEFGVTAWAELANIQDMHEDLVTIGWFHTHPGHGLFLSQPDLRIHEGFFKSNYQLAMEIDTKSTDLDVAFFTRDVNGVIYNSRDRISPSWFRWKEFITKEGVRLK